MVTKKFIGLINYHIEPIIKMVDLLAIPNGLVWLQKLTSI